MPELTESQIEIAAEAGWQEARKNPFFQGVEDYWNRLQEIDRRSWRLLVKAIAPHAQYATTKPLDGYLIEKACAAYECAKDQDYNGSPSEKRDCMTAAARVIVDALLSPVADDEWISHDDGKTVQATRYGVNQILAKRRARIEAKPKTDAEKIADMLIAKGPDTPDAYRQVAAEIVEKLKADRTRVESR